MCVCMYVCNNTITKDPTTPKVCRYTTLWNVTSVCSLQCVTARRPAAAPTSNAGIFHGCLVVDRHREHVGSNIRCWLWLPARWRRCYSSPIHTLQGTHWRTCGVRTSRSSSLTSGPQTARTWIQSITLFEVPFSRWSINVDDSRQSTSWSSRSSLSGANCRSVSLIAPLVSGVVGLSASSSSKAETLNIWCKTWRMWKLLQTITETIYTVFPVDN